MKLATPKQLVKVLDLINQKEVSAEQLQALLEGGYIADLLDANLSVLIRDTFRVACGLQKLFPDPIITDLAGIVLPDLAKTLGDRMADGAYDWKNSDITAERFPLTLPAGPRDLVTAWFQRDMKSEAVEQWAAKNGYDVSPIDDLLAVGAHPVHRELQRQFPIIAPGSSAVIDGHRHVPYLDGDDSERDLDLDWYDYGWSGYCRFLLARKKSLDAGTPGT